MRKIKDHFYYKAKKEGYPARSVYKLQEIDKKYHIIKKGMNILDIGASPGSWSRYCAEKAGKKGLVIGIDKNAVKPGFGVKFIQQDIFALDIDKIKQICPVFDVVLSDLAPSTTGIRDIDQVHSLQLAQAAYRIAQELLKTGGHFVCKVFQGPDTKQLLRNIQEKFNWIKALKPAGSRKESFEIYILGYEKK